MSRIFWRLFFSLWLSIMAFAMLTALINATLARQHLPEPPDVAFNRSIQKVEAMLSEAFRLGGPERARRTLERLPRPIRSHVFVIDEGGRELLGRDNIRRHLERAERQPVRRSFQDPQGRRWDMVVLRRAPPVRLLEPGFRGILHRLLMAALISAVVSYFLARYLSRPLERLGRASRQLATGDLSTRVGPPLVERRDEFGVLARDLDDMAGRLQRLQHANRRLLRDVSHELRSPLARLQVAVELARKRGADQVAGELDRIELEGRRLETLVGEVLDLLQNASESVPLRPERFELCALLGELREAAAYEMPGDAAGIRLDCPGGLWLDADRELIWRAIENLLRNALIHSGGQQEVDLGGRELPGGQEIEIRVRDRGPGVPEQHLERIFDAFYRVEEARDRRTGGHGLGMAIAAAAVRRHQGNIAARNHPEGGLEVVVTLPAWGS